MVSTGANVLIGWVNTGTSSIDLLAVNGSNLTGTKVELQLADLHSDYLWDMAWNENGNDATDGNGWVVLVYKDTTVGQFRILFLDTAGAIHPGQAPLTDTSPSAEIVTGKPGLPNHYRQ